MTLSVSLHRLQYYLIPAKDKCHSRCSRSPRIFLCTSTKNKYPEAYLKQTYTYVRTELHRLLFVFKQYFTLSGRQSCEPKSIGTSNRRNKVGAKLNDGIKSGKQLRVLWVSVIRKQVGQCTSACGASAIFVLCCKL